MLLSFLMYPGGGLASLLFIEFSFVELIGTLLLFATVTFIIIAIIRSMR